MAAKLFSGLIEACTENGRLHFPDDDGRIVLLEETDSPERIEENLEYSVEEAPF